MQKSEKLTHDSQEPFLVVQMQTPFLPVCFLHACLWAHTHFFGLQWVCVWGLSGEVRTHTHLCWGFLWRYAHTHVCVGSYGAMQAHIFIKLP